MVETKNKTGLDIMLLIMNLAGICQMPNGVHKTFLANLYNLYQIGWKTKSYAPG